MMRELRVRAWLCYRSACERAAFAVSWCGWLCAIVWLKYLYHRQLFSVRQHMLNAARPKVPPAGPFDKQSLVVAYPDAFFSLTVADVRRGRRAALARVEERRCRS